MLCKYAQKAISIAQKSLPLLILFLCFAVLEGGMINLCININEHSKALGKAFLLGALFGTAGMIAATTIAITILTLFTNDNFGKKKHIS